MERQQRLDGLQFDDNAVFDEEIDSISGVEHHILVDNRKFDLMFETQSVSAELVLEAGVVRALKTTGSDRGMYLERRGDYPLGHRIVWHADDPSASSASSAVACVQAPVR